MANGATDVVVNEWKESVQADARAGCMTNRQPTVRTRQEGHMDGSPGQPGHCCLFLAQYSPQPFILCPECRYAVFPAPVCEPRLCVGGVLQYDHTAAERAQVGHDLSEMERGVCRLEALSF